MYWMSKNQKTGLSGEQWTLSQLQERDYQARLLSGWTDEADLIITAPVACPVLVESKLATRRERWQKNGDYWFQRFFYSWEVSRLPERDLVVVLAADVPTGHPSGETNRVAFVVPSWAIAARGQAGRGVSVIHLASDPAAYAARGRGWLAPFFGEWDRVIADVAASCQRRTRQLNLFEV